MCGKDCPLSDRVGAVHQNYALRPKYFERPPPPAPTPAFPPPLRGGRRGARREALFYLWRATADVRYREWGWEAFRAVNESCRAPGGGYAQLQDVTQRPAGRGRVRRRPSPSSPCGAAGCGGTSLDLGLPMPSYWFAETLLYAWLLFAPASAVPLDEWVLNTEGHPLRRRRVTPHAKWPPAARAERQRLSALS
eukprot:gene14104-17484_t